MNEQEIRDEIQNALKSLQGDVNDYQSTIEDIVDHITSTLPYIEYLCKTALNVSQLNRPKSMQDIAKIAEDITLQNLGSAYVGDMRKRYEALGLTESLDDDRVKQKVDSEKVYDQAYAKSTDTINESYAFDGAELTSDDGMEESPVESTEELVEETVSEDFVSEDESERDTAFDGTELSDIGTELTDEEPNAIEREDNNDVFDDFNDISVNDSDTEGIPDTTEEVSVDTTEEVSVDTTEETKLYIGDQSIDDISLDDLPTTDDASLNGVAYEAEDMDDLEPLDDTDVSESDILLSENMSDLEPLDDTENDEFSSETTNATSDEDQMETKPDTNMSDSKKVRRFAIGWSIVLSACIFVSMLILFGVGLGIPSVQTILYSLGISLMSAAVLIMYMQPNKANKKKSKTKKNDKNAAE